MARGFNWEKANFDKKINGYVRTAQERAQLPATEKQKVYIGKLCKEKRIPYIAAETVQEASLIINDLKKGNISKYKLQHAESKARSRISNKEEEIILDSLPGTVSSIKKSTGYNQKDIVQGLKQLREQKKIKHNGKHGYILSSFTNNKNKLKNNSIEERILNATPGTAKQISIKTKYPMQKLSGILSQLSLKNKIQKVGKVWEKVN